MLLLGACGETDAAPVPAPTAADEQTVKRVVTKFSEADDVDACELLTQEALERLYGGFRGCLSKADEFTSGTVEIAGVDFSPDADGARVKATTLDRERAFQIGLRKVSGECGGVSGTATGDWRISSVREAEPPV